MIVEHRVGKFSGRAKNFIQFERGVVPIRIELARGFNAAHCTGIAPKRSLRCNLRRSLYEDVRSQQSRNSARCRNLPSTIRTAPFGTRARYTRVEKQLGRGMSPICR